MLLNYRYGTLNCSSRYPGSQVLPVSKQKCRQHDFANSKGRTFQGPIISLEMLPGEKPTLTAGLTLGLERTRLGTWELPGTCPISAPTPPPPNQTHCCLCSCSNTPGAALGRAAALLDIIRSTDLYLLPKQAENPPRPRAPLPPHLSLQTPTAFSFHKPCPPLWGWRKQL